MSMEQLGFAQMHKPDNISPAMYCHVFAVFAPYDVNKCEIRCQLE